jgi:hypothetical protein
MRVVDNKPRAILPLHKARQSSYVWKHHRES